LGDRRSGMKQCKKCGREKLETSFPKRYDRGRTGREHTCGMCKKRAHVARHPEAKRLEGVRRRARSKGLSVEDYLREQEAWKDRIRAEKNTLKVRKCLHRKCPVISAHPKVEYRIFRQYYLNKSKDWGRRNPDKAYAKKQRRRFRLANVNNDLTAEQWAGIQRAFNYRCAYCGRRAKLTQDHVTPISHGGHHTLSNIVPACSSCNSSKHTGPPPRPVQTLLIV